MLYSTREYKKTRVRYFVDDYEKYRVNAKPDPVSA